LKQCEVEESGWRTLVEPRPFVFAILIIAGISLEFIIHYQMKISIVYSHFYYLIIVVAGLWYGKKAIYVALFFGLLLLVNSYIITGILSPDSLIRVCMFCVVGFVLGLIVEQMNCYRNVLVEQNNELQKINNQLRDSQKSFETANKKLNLLSSITRHDINNQLMVLLSYIELSREKIRDSVILNMVAKEEAAAHTIMRQIQFTKSYQDIGVHAPQWQNVPEIISQIQKNDTIGAIEISIRLNGLEIYADPLLEKVFFNLIDNSRRHGERVTSISFSFITNDKNIVTLIYEDNGTGVQDTDKERIFEKGFGKNTGFGLFLSREILAITELSIKETGIYGKCARFEILIPLEKYRFAHYH